MQNKESLHLQLGNKRTTFINDLFKLIKGGLWYPQSKSQSTPVYTRAGDWKSQAFYCLHKPEFTDEATLALRGACFTLHAEPVAYGRCATFCPPRLSICGWRIMTPLKGFLFQVHENTELTPHYPNDPIDTHLSCTVYHSTWLALLSPQGGGGPPCCSVSPFRSSQEAQ